MTTSATVPNTGTQSAANPLKGLLAYGQSPWMDYIRRDLLTGGGLKKFIAEDGLRGQTSNPTIFEKAINGSTLYNDILNSPEAKSLNAKQLYEKIAIRDVQDACDIFRPVYDESKHRDGYVSLEVSPLLANDTNGTMEEARRIWKAVNRPNVMIKVPATPEGVPAIRQLLEDGLNINITLLFAQSAYEKVAEAFIAALEARAAKGQPINQIASVASFFVSRIDTLVDSKIDALLKPAAGDAKILLESLHGTIAIANAKLTYFVGELGVGDGDGAVEAFKQNFGVAGGGLEQSVDFGIDEGVNAADEETGDAGDLVDGLALGGAGFESGDEGLGDLFVGGLGEEQSDVDVQAVFEKLADGGDALGSGGNLDHDIGAVDGLPEAAGFFHGAVGVVGEEGRDFEADIAVAVFALVVDGTEDVTGVLDVANGDFFVELLGVQGFGFWGIKNVVVERAAVDGFFKDGGIGGLAAQAVLGDEFFQTATGEQVAADVVHPGRLAVGEEAFERIGSGLASSIWNSC